MSVTVRRHGRVLHLQGPGLDLSIELGLGQSHTWTCDDPQRLDALAAALDDHGLWVLPSDGGLLSGMSVGANLALALSDGVHRASVGQDAALQDALQAAGMSAEKIARLHRLMPNELNALELWTVAWAMAMLRAPELLVLDQALGHLNHAQQSAVLNMVGLFQRTHPHTPVLWLHQAPSLVPAFGTSQVPEEAACLS